MRTSDFAIETDGLTKVFRHKTAVDSLTLQVPTGSVCAFIGRNGSGKTTTIRMLLGFLSPTSGSARVLGHDSANLSPDTRGTIGYMSETHPLHDWMTVKQEASFASQFYDDWNTKLFDSILAHFRISPDADIRDLSPGERAGVALAVTLAPEPKLLILDDPAAGLDPVARKALLDKVSDATRVPGRTVLFSSHQLGDVERMADYAAVLDYNRLRIAGPIDEIKASVRRDNSATQPPSFADAVLSYMTHDSETGATNASGGAR
jgi:ABC-2 type transport system ATP-binding protein